MKSDTLNGVLTFILGVVVVLGVYFALKVFFLTSDSRKLQRQALLANNRIMQARALVADAQAYNKSYPSPELTRILQPLQPPTR